MKNFLFKTTPWLGLILGTLLGVGVASAQLTPTISVYVPTTTGPTTAQVSLACEEVGYHAYTFEIATENFPSSNYDDYYADIYQLRFNLHQDFVDNVDLTDMDCTIPLTNSGSPIYINCDGGTFTRVNSTTNLRIDSALTMNANGTARVTMTYMDPDDDDTREPTLPWITTDPNYENFIQQSISFHDNGNVIGGETATTDAEIFQIVYGFNYNSNGNWSASSITPLPDNPSIGFDNNNWYDDGDTAIANFEGCEQLACADLIITSPTQLTFANLGQNVVTRLNFATEDQNGDPWPGEYLVRGLQSDGVTPSTCQLSDNCFGNSNFCINWQNDQITTTDTNPGVRNCQLGDIVAVQEVDFPATCNNFISFNDGCAGLNITSTQIINNTLGEFTRVDVAATTINGQPWPLPYIYTVTNAAGAPAWRQFGTSPLQASLALTTTAFQTDATTVYIRNLQPGDDVQVQAAGGYGNVCNDNFQVADECIEMGVTPTTITVEDIDAPTQITLTPQGANGPWNGTYTYSATNSAGGPSTCEFAPNYIQSFLHAGVNSITTPFETVWVNDCGEGDIITITETAYPAVCYGTITVEEEVPACLGLTISPSSIVETDLPQTFTITPNPSNWPGPWVWTTNNPAGTFTEVANPTNTGNTITTITHAIIYDGDAFDVLTVTEGTTFGTVCRATAIIEEEEAPLVCIGLTLNPTSVVSSSLPQTFTITPNPSIWPGPWVWTTTNSAGIFTEVATPTNTGNSITTPTLQISYQGAAGDVITVREGTTFGNVCNATANITPPPPPSGPPGGGGPTSPPGGGGPNYCGDKVIQQPNGSNPPKIEVCDEGPIGGIIREGRPYAGQWCSNSCEIESRNPTPTPQPNDELTKSVETYNFGWFNVLGPGTINADCFGSGAECNRNPPYAHDFDYAFYQLIYKPDAEYSTTVKITDSISSGSGLRGQDVEGNTYNGGVNFYRAQSDDPREVKTWVDAGLNDTPDDMRLFYEGTDLELPRCAWDEEEEGELETTVTCYEGTLGNPAGVTLNNLDKPEKNAKIVIHYLGQVYNGNQFDCTKLLNPTSSHYSSCPVQYFTNVATTDTGQRAEADIAIVCPFFLTRNAGDVYINPGTPLETYDLSCYYDRFKNSDALVITDEDIGGGSLLSRFSTYIGKLFTKLEDRWEQLTVRSQVKDRNIGAVTRYKENENLATYLPISENETIEINDMANQLLFSNTLRNNPKQNVYQIVGKDLVLNLGANGNKVPPGAYTFIVREGDLHIKSDLQYAGTDEGFKFSTVSDLKQIPSIAFIVIGGNVEVDSRVSKMVGVYYVQSENGVGGQLTGDWTDPFTELEIHGSVYGNINSLLGQRTFAGPANYDHGNVVLRYDERILLNPPPGLEEYVDLSSERVAR